MKFKYKKYGPGILRPVIPIELVHKDKVIKYEVLVDSGADICIFDAQIGEVLNLDVESGEKQEVSGITGSPEYYYLHTIIMRVGGHAHSLRAGFLPRIARLGYGVVGQHGFFDLFVVKFDFKKEEIELMSRR